MDRITMLEVTGDTTEVWQRYIAGLYENHGQDQATIRGHRITQAQETPNPIEYNTGEYTQTLTLIEGADLPHPVLAVEISSPCD